MGADTAGGSNFANLQFRKDGCMPRVSATASSIVKLISRTERLHPPEELTEEQRDEFIRIVDKMPADWFTPANQAGLVQLCRHVVMARRFAQLIEEIISSPGEMNVKLAAIESLAKAQQQESRLINSLMTSLRMTPQAIQPSRTSPTKLQQLQIQPWK
jgi:hypothetical protein